MRTSHQATACLLALALLAVTAGTSAAPPTGDHVVVRFRMDDPGLDETAVVAVQDADGDLVMYAFVDGNRLHVTDGSSGGTDRPPKTLASSVVGTSWHRVDVVLNGSTYTLHLDQEHSITARTFENAATGTWVADPRPLHSTTYEDVEWDRQRADRSGMAHDDTFASTTTTWQQVTDGGSISLQPNGIGHQGTGRAEVLSARGLGTAYLRAPTTGMGGAYVAEASVSVPSNLNQPLGHVALAGLSGAPDAPDVHWAVAVDRAPLAANAWALFFVDGSGDRVQVSPAWMNTLWHAVRVEVDEPGDRIEVSVDGGAPSVFSTKAGTSTHVGAGDVHALLPVGAGQMPLRLDDLALYEEAL